jgi:enamine deaminase RidA (YjgF/YER057c/UK114 family)
MSTAPFSPVRIAGDLAFISGQGATLADGTVAAGGIAVETKIVLTKIIEALETLDATIDDLVAVTCYLSDISDWDAMNVVWSQFFAGHTAPTRTAIGVAGLPKGFLVEMTATVFLGTAKA